MPSHGAPEPAQVKIARVVRLKRRADFLRAAKGRRWHGAALSLQGNGRDRGDASVESSDGGPRVGFTLTKKVGCAVIRNRARRRLREAVRLSPDLPLQPGFDYVIVGRESALRLPFEALRDEVARAVRAVHAGPTPQKSRRPNRDGSQQIATGENAAGRTEPRRTP